MSTVVNNAGADPLVYLTSSSRIALQLEGPSDRPQSVVQAAQEAYYATHGQWPYVDGMSNELPPPPATTIGTVAGTGDDVNDQGDTVAFDEGKASTVTAEFDGDSKDVTYKWTIRTGGEYISIVGTSTDAGVVIAGDASGGPATIRCKLTSATASDSPKELTMNVIVKAPAGPNSAKKSTAKK